jgi:malonyl-CoA O-methyltransferase
MGTNTNHLQKKLIKRFNKSANNYKKYAIAQQKMAENLLERLSFFNINPKNILDLGCGKGELSQALTELYPQANIFSLDFAEQMLSNKEYADKIKIYPIVADAHKLPLQDNSTEVIISNAVLHWSLELNQLLKESKRILKENGLFIFTTYGVDTLYEWKEAWFKTDPYKQYTNTFVDMHDIGDFLMRLGFSHPVVDRDKLTINYSKIETLIEDLKGIGSTLTHPNKNKGLSTKNTWNKMKNNYPRQENGKYPLTWEIINAHCFNSPPPPAKYPQPYEIPLSELKK